MAYATATLADFRRRCRRSGVSPPPDLLALALLLEHGGDAPCAPEADVLLLPLPEVARRLNVSLRAAERLVASGALSSVRVDGCRRVAVVDLLAYVDRLRAG